MLKKFVPQTHFDHFQLQEKIDRIKLLSVDYFELYFLIVDQNNKVTLFCLKTLSKIFSSEIYQITIDEVNFGKLSQKIICYSFTGKLIVFNLDG